MTPEQKKEVDKLKDIFGDEAVTYAEYDCGHAWGVGLSDKESEWRYAIRVDRYGSCRFGRMPEKRPVSEILVDIVRKRPGRHPSLNAKLAEYESETK